MRWYMYGAVIYQSLCIKWTVDLLYVCMHDSTADCTVILTIYDRARMQYARPPCNNKNLGLVPFAKGQRQLVAAPAGVHQLGSTSSS